MLPVDSVGAYLLIIKLTHCIRRNTGPDARRRTDITAVGDM